MRAIPATRGYVAIVDEEDFYWLSAFKWRAVATTKKDGRWTGFRPVRTLPAAEGRGSVFMYRQIMRPPPGMEVDHINGDPWDNRRCNLRICTRAQNAKNTRNANGSLKGVARTKGGLQSRIRLNGRNHTFGKFGSEREAALAYDAAALALYGEFAALNFPDAGTEPRHPYQIHEDCWREETAEKDRLRSAALDALRRGLTVRATAKETGASRAVVWRWAKEAGMELTRRRPRNSIIDRHNSPAPSSRAGVVSVGLANLDGLAAAAGLSSPLSPVVAGGAL